MLIVVFGKISSGKTYIADKLSKYLNFHHIKGDDFFTSFQKKFGFFSKKQVKNYVIKQLIPGIEAAFKEHKNIVVCQSLYYESHRAIVAEHFKNSQNMEPLFIQINISKRLYYEQLYSIGLHLWLYAKFKNITYEKSSTAYKIYNLLDDFFGPEFMILKRSHPYLRSLTHE
ncbi:MAG: hypothetical protein Harvfovirus39_15 [Harvfovirus sp.]|uniref:Uncharacterized protein n=1 Tax=Harvfovirus sp. TaxID=2487768 RepID=A0A3G5A2T5_9VIRU|nr:MAG: hypothetical protein Harvfovirus39_15 [Harvfovirus sp.]